MLTLLSTVTYLFHEAVFSLSFAEFFVQFLQATWSFSDVRIDFASTILRRLRDYERDSWYDYTCDYTFSLPASLW